MRSTKAQKAVDNAHFAADLTEEVEKIDRLIGLNRGQRRQLGIYLTTKQLKDTRDYLEDEIKKATASV